MTNKVDPIEKPAVPEKKGVQQTPAESALHENTIQPLEYTAPSIRWDAKQVLSRPSEGSLGVYNSVQRTPLTPAATIPSAATTHHIAAQGVQGQGHRLPHLPQVERSFGQDLSHLRAYTDSTAKDSCRSIGARAYATGHKIAFSESNPSLHTVSHEAAHAALQSSDATRTLKDGIGQTGDKFERHADAVAEKVVQGQSLGSLLTQFSSGGETQSQATQKLTDDTDNQPVQKSTDSRTSSGKPIVQMMNEQFPDPPAIVDPEGAAPHPTAQGKSGQYEDYLRDMPMPNSGVTYEDPWSDTGACTGARIITAGETYSDSESAPKDLKNMKNYKKKNRNFLQDPTSTRGYTAIRMHALNNHLYPDELNAQRNMFIGTGTSNKQHLTLVERPIKTFVNHLQKQKIYTSQPWGTHGWVDYTVTPIYTKNINRLPQYIENNLADLGDNGSDEFAEEREWLAHACPLYFNAEAIYYIPGRDPRREAGSYSTDPGNSLPISLESNQFRGIDLGAVPHPIEQDKSALYKAHLNGMPNSGVAYAEPWSDTGACTYARIITAGETYSDSESAPKDLRDMKSYKQKGQNFLKDPTSTRGYTAIRMHALNNHLYPDELNAQRNMFIGTGISNKRHLALVEKPIKTFVSNLRKQKIFTGEPWGTHGWVDYTVIPKYTSDINRLPQYIENNLADLGDNGSGKFAAERKWLAQACPLYFNAKVDYHYFNENNDHQINHEEGNYSTDWDKNSSPVSDFIQSIDGSEFESEEEALDQAYNIEPVDLRTSVRDKELEDQYTFEQIDELPDYAWAHLVSEYYDTDLFEDGELKQDVADAVDDSLEIFLGEYEGEGNESLQESWESWLDDFVNFLLDIDEENRTDMQIDIDGKSDDDGSEVETASQLASDEDTDEKFGDGGSEVEIPSPLGVPLGFNKGTHDDGTRFAFGKHFSWNSFDRTFPQTMIYPTTMPQESSHFGGSDGLSFNMSEQPFRFSRTSPRHRRGRSKTKHADRHHFRSRIRPRHRRGRSKTKHADRHRFRSRIRPRSYSRSRSRSRSRSKSPE